MQPQHRQRIRDLFERAIELPPAQRDALVEASPEPDTIKAEVQALLLALRDSGEYQHTSGIFLLPTQVGTAQPGPSPTTLAPAPATSAAAAFKSLHSISPAAMVGTAVGPFELLEHIGEGGFGDVFRARQIAPVRRTVALKILKPGMDSHAILTRFEQERQALALMDHPGIARVLDAGVTPDGRPFVALEFVPGEPINTYCDSRRLPIRQRIELHKSVCEAVQHAHQRGIIHRDLKPSNVLVIPPDSPGGAPTAKVIDFGIAKATGDRLTDTTIITGQRQLIGTPEYMSPEQATLASGQIDTRTDVYSLGILLYQLLTGTTPLDPRSLRAMPIGTMQQMIREIDPPRPSTRLRTLAREPGTTPATGTAAPATEPSASSAPAPAHTSRTAPPTAELIAAARGTDLPRLKRTLAGELDWIVMKAIDPDRTRRYDSASSLAADLGRYLQGRGVEAGPPSGLYRLRVIVRRNRIPFAVASAILLTLVLGLAIASVGFAQARRDRDRADAARADTERLLSRSAMAAASAGLQTGNGALALANLRSVPLEARQWEWQLLHRLVERQTVSIALRPDQRIAALWPMASPDRMFATTAPPNESVLILDLTSGSIVREFPGGPGAISPDDTLIAQLTSQGLIVSDAATGRLLWRAPAPATRWSFGPAAFSLDSTQLVAADGSGRLTVFDARSGAVLHTPLPSPPADDCQGFVTPGIGDQQAILYSASQRFHLHTVSSGTSTHTLMGYRLLADRRHTSSVTSFGNLGTGGEITTFGTTASTPVTTADLSANGQLAVFGDASGGITIARTTPDAPGTLRSMHRFPGTGSHVQIITLTSDAARIVMASADGRCTVVPTAAFATEFSPALHRCFTATFSPDRRFLLRAAWGEVSLIDTVLSLPVWSRSLAGLMFTSAAFSPDGTSIIVATRPRDPGGPSELYCLQAETGAQRWAIGKTAATPDPRHGRASPPWLGHVRGLGFSSDSSKVLLALEDGTLLALNAATGELATQSAQPGSDAAANPNGSLQAGTGPSFVLLPPRGQLLVHIYPSGTPMASRLPQPEAAESHILIRDPGTLAIRRILKLPGQLITAATISADGQHLDLGTRDGTLTRLNTTNGETIWRTPAPSPSCAALALSPDQTRLVAAFSPSQLASFDTRTGGLIAQLPSDAVSPTAMAFTSDGLSLLISAVERPLIRLDAAPGDPATLQQLLAGPLWPSGVPHPPDTLHARAWLLDAHELITSTLASSWTLAEAAERIASHAGQSETVRRLAAALLPRRDFPLREANNRALLILMDPSATRSDLQNAARLLADIASRNPTDASVHLNLGEVLFRLDRFAECIPALETGDALQVGRQAAPPPQARYALVIALARTGELTRAAHWLTLADQAAAAANAPDPPAIRRAELARSLVSRGSP